MEIGFSNHQQIHLTQIAQYLRSIQTVLAVQNSIENTDCEKTHKWKETK